MKRLILVLLVGLLLLGACAPTRVSEPAIPAHYTTYIDKAGLFSISYPPKWELGLSLIEGKTIFVAGKPYQDGYNPNVSITVIPIDDRNWKLEDFVETMVQQQIMFLKEYHEFSRTKIVVGGREAVVLDSETQFPVIGSMRTLTMYLHDHNLVWMVVCGIFPANNFSDFETDFHAIVRSLRILK